MLLAVASASASASTWHWYSCQNVGSGIGSYQDAACSKPVAGGGNEWTSLKNGQATALKSSNTEPFVIGMRWAGLTIKTTCASQSLTGSAENFAEGAGSKGILRNAVLTMTGCVVTEPAKGCTARSPGAKPGEIKTFALTGVSGETSTPKGIKFEPAGGTEYMQMMIENCTTNLNGTYPFKGSEIGTVNEPGTIAFTEASSSLTVAGNPATWIGKDQLKEASSGRALKFGP